MENPKLGRDYGITVNMPWWLVILSYIPIVNLFVTQKVKIQVVAFTDKGEPITGVFRNMRIPRMWVCPLRFNFAFPDTVPANLTLYVYNRKETAIYCRSLKDEFKGMKMLAEGNWVKGVEIEKIDETEH